MEFLRLIALDLAVLSIAVAVVCIFIHNRKDEDQ